MIIFPSLKCFVGLEEGHLVDCEDENEDLCLLLALLGQQDGLDVGENTALRNGDAREELVQLLVVANGELQVTGDDARLLVITSGIACQLENLSSEVFHHRSEVHGGTSANALGIVPLAEETMDTSHGELQTSAG